MREVIFLCKAMVLVSLEMQLRNALSADDILLYKNTCPYASNDKDERETSDLKIHK